MTDKTLEHLLQADGWPLERLDANTWRSGFRSEGNPAFRFFIRMTKNWLVLTVIPYVTLNEPEDPRVLRRLLELNRDLTLAKLAVDKQDVLLTVELPLEELQPSQLKDGLDAMVFYANQHHAELVSLIGELRQ